MQLANLCNDRSKLKKTIIHEQCIRKILLKSF